MVARVDDREKGGRVAVSSRLEGLERLASSQASQAPQILGPILVSIQGDCVEITTSGAQRRLTPDFSGRHRRPDQDFSASGPEEPKS